MPRKTKIKMLLMLIIEEKICKKNDEISSFFYKLFNKALHVFGPTIPSTERLFDC